SQRLRNAATVDIRDDVAIRQGETEVERTGLKLSRRCVRTANCPSRHWVASIVRAEPRPIARGRERVRRSNLLKRRVLYGNAVAPSSSCQDAKRQGADARDQKSHKSPHFSPAAGCTMD